MKLKKLNSHGFSHDVILVLFVTLFAIVGVAYLVGTHAAALTGDVNNDSVVNGLDLSILLQHYGGSYSPADLNNDGTVNAYDEAILLSHLSAAGSKGQGTTNFTFSKSSFLSAKNKSFTVGIYENSGTSPVNVITSSVSYDASKLKFVSSACGSVINNLGGTIVPASGKVALTCFVQSGGSISGSHQVGTLTFVGASTSSSSISFANGSIIANNGKNIWNNNTSNSAKVVIQ